MRAWASTLATSSYTTHAWACLPSCFLILSQKAMMSTTSSHLSMADQIKKTCACTWSSESLLQLKSFEVVSGIKRFTARLILVYLLQVNKQLHDLRWGLGRGGMSTLMEPCTDDMVLNPVPKQEIGDDAFSTAALVTNLWGVLSGLIIGHDIASCLGDWYYIQGCEQLILSLDNNVPLERSHWLNHRIHGLEIFFLDVD